MRITTVFLLSCPCTHDGSGGGGGGSGGGGPDKLMITELLIPSPAGAGEH